VNQLLLPMEIIRYNKLKMAHKMAQVLNDLESEYSKVIAPIMDELMTWKDLLGVNFAILMHRDNEMVKVATKYRLVRACHSCSITCRQ
jgi:5'(3')-deoxyribonucleotidase